MLESAEAVYNDWVRSHYRFLLRSAWALTGSLAVAEDVVQDCFALAWRHHRQLRDATLARAWLFSIMRRSAWRQLKPAQREVAPLDDDVAADVPAETASLDDRIDVLRALSRLAPIHREVLALFYFDDMPTAVMAEALDIAPGTVLSRLARARDALRAELGGGPSPSERRAAAPRAGVVTPIRRA